MRWLRELSSGAPTANQADSWAAMQIRAATVTALIVCILLTVIESMLAAGHGAELAFVLCAALVTIGYIVGLLFALPRILANSADSNTERGAAEGNDPPRPLYSINANLEQISDWLTKIIVGVGLVESQRIAGSVSRGATLLGAGLTAQQPSLSPNAAFALAMGMLLACPSLGFLLGFFSIRLYISRALLVSDATVTRPVDAASVLGEAASQVRVSVLEEAPRADDDVERDPSSTLERIDDASKVIAQRTLTRLPAEQDAVLQLAAVRISVERVLRRLCLIAGLIGDEDAVSFSKLLETLHKADLMDRSLADALRRVYQITSAAMHGRSVIRDDADDIKVAGQRLIDQLLALPHDPNWFIQAIIRRGHSRGISISRASQDSASDLIAGDVTLLLKTWRRVTYSGLKRELRHDRMVAVLSHEPRGTLKSQAQSESHTFPLIWLDDIYFRGTVAAFGLAEWLVDVPVL